VRIEPGRGHARLVRSQDWSLPEFIVQDPDVPAKAASQSGTVLRRKPVAGAPRQRAS